MAGVGLVFTAIMVAPIDSVWLGGEALSLRPARLVAWGTASATCALAGAALIAARRRVSAPNLALVVGALVVCLATSELVLAALGYKPSKRIVLRVPAHAPWWQSVPSLSGTPMQSGSARPQTPDGDWRLNAQYMLDTDDFSAESAAEFSRRVLLLGDSFAYGVVASSQSKSFAELLDRGLDASAPAVVWNASVPGTGQRTMFSHFERFAPLLKPQVVIATLFGNDFLDNALPPGRFYVFTNGKFVDGFRETPDGVKRLTPEAAFRRAFAPQLPREYLKTLRTPVGRRRAVSTYCGARPRARA